MRYKNASMLCLRLALLGAFVLTAGSAVAQPPSRFRSPVSVGVEPQTVKTLETAREHIREGQWEQAIPILQELIETGSDSLVPLEPGRYGNVADYCHLLISYLPPAGLGEYRKRLDGQAGEWLTAGRAGLDDVPLQRIVDRAFNSSFGDEALWLLGELAFERGRYAQARHYWQLLVAPHPEQAAAEAPETTAAYLTYVGADVDTATVHARLVLCSIFEGDVRRAADEVSAFRLLHSEVEGTLAGATGHLADILDSQLQQARSWLPSSSSSDRNSTFAGRQTRGPVPAGDPAVSGLAWRDVVVPRSRLKGPADRNDTLASFPVVHDRTVFVANAGSVYAFDLLTGRPKWPVEDGDSGEIMTTLLQGPVMADLPSSGVPRYTLTIGDGRLYARMGLPFTRRSIHEGSSYTELVGIDLKRQGDISFRATPDVLDAQADSPEATHWSFTGSPVVTDGRVYSTARRGSPEDEIAVTCFDVETSQLIWQRRVCVNLRNVPDHYNLVGHQLLTLGDGRLFLTTGTGAVAALDAATGRLLWVIAWPDTNDESYDQESNPQRHGLVPGLYHQGVLYTVTRANELFALDATTGQPVWQRQIGDRILHLLGIVNGRLILSGNSLWAVDVHSGEDAWPLRPRVGFADPDGYGYGRGVITERSVYWPLRDEILRIDHRSGEITRRIALRQRFGIQGGNLLISNNVLLIARPDRLHALADLESLSRLNDSATHDETSNETPAEQPEQTPDNVVPLESDVETPGTTTSIWPVRRRWQFALSPDSIVSLPETAEGPGKSTQVVVQQAATTELLDGSTGTSFWTMTTGGRLLWTGSYREQLLLAYPQHIESRSRATGRLNWRMLPSSGQFQTVRLLRSPGTPTSVRLAAQTETGVAAVDPISGENLWLWPPSGRSRLVSKSDAWGQAAKCILGSSVLLFGRNSSADCALLDLRSGIPVQRGTLPFDNDSAVQFVPTSGSSRPALIGITSVNSLQLSRLAELGPQWVRPATAKAHGRPRVLVSGEIVVVVEDAQFAIRRDPDSGDAIWKQSLGPVPVNDVINEVVFSDTALMAFSAGTLRCFSLDDGSLIWRRHLGSGAIRLSLNNGVVICQSIPEGRKTKTVPVDYGNVAVCDAATGDRIQSLVLTSPAELVNVHAGRDFCCIHTTDMLTGLVPYTME